MNHSPHLQVVKKTILFKTRPRRITWIEKMLNMIYATRGRYRGSQRGSYAGDSDRLQ